MRIAGSHQVSAFAGRVSVTISNPVLGTEKIQVPATGSPYTVQEMLIEMMTPGGSIVPLPSGTKHHPDISHPPVWPQTPFVQPL